MLSPRHRGFTLLEVMVALVVLTIGLLGLAALLGTSVRSNNVGMLHTHASFLAENILDRMRSNIQGVWLDAYDGTFDGTGTTPSPRCITGEPCTAAQLARLDAYNWGVSVSQLLPNGSGRVACTPSTPAPTGNAFLSVPIYDGSCRITLTWNEVGETVAGVEAQTLEWVVQP